MNGPLRALGYARVSSRDQVDGYSLDLQEQHIRNWCEQTGVDLVAMHRGEGESGKDLERTAFQELLGTLERERDITHVVVTKLDRLSRSFRDTAHLLHDWEERGIRFIAVDDGLTDLAGTNRLVAHILAFVADDERKRINQRILPGRIARVEAGLPPGRVPIGYRIVTDLQSPRGRLEIDDRLAPVVRAAFALAAEKDWGADRIARELERDYAATLRETGRDGLGRGLLQRMLANPVYTGVLSARLGEHPILRYGNHQAIVDEATFGAVQEQRRRRAAVMGRGQADYNAKSLLGGLIQCAGCGAVMTWLDDGSLHGVYACMSGYRSGGTCGAEPVPARTVDMLVVDQLLRTLMELGSRLDELWLRGIREATGDLDAARQEARRILEGHDRAVVAAVAALEAGSLGAPAFRERNAELERQRRAARARVDAVDVWQWLTRLFGRDDDGTWRDDMIADGGLSLRLPFDVLVNAGGRLSWRQLIRAATRRLAVRPGPPVGIDGDWSDDEADYAILARMEGKVLTRGLLIDQRRVLRAQGWQRSERRPDGSEVWTHQEYPNDLELPSPAIIAHVHLDPES